MDLAWAHPGVIHLEVGDPNFVTPRHVVEAALSAALAGDTHYGPNAGLPRLRELIAHKLRTLNGVEAQPENVVVTPGSGEALFVAALALLDPLDEILLPDPGWPNFEQIAISVRATPVRYPLMRGMDFLPDLDRLKALITPRTRAILLNSPSNPTGAVLSADAIAEVMRLADHYGLWVISDECYEQLVFEGEHISPARSAGLERTVVIHSFSKTYAMTGWRVGYLACEPELATRIAKLQEPIVSCPSTISQRAAEAALEGPQDAVAAMRGAYQRRRDAAVAIAAAADLVASRPHGAFYLMLDAGKEVDTLAYARWLIEEFGVAVAPGDTFGPGGSGMIRISLAADDEDITRGVRLIVAAQAHWSTLGKSM